MSSPLAILAPAKINLCLHVTGRRADGYHTLCSLMAFVDLADRIEAAPDRDGHFSLSIDGPFAPALGGLGDDNLVLRAARALARAQGIPAGAKLRLTKVIPVAGGLGGGSADAAAVLLALCDLWELGRPKNLGDIALGLGADVPVCLLSRTARVTGIGEGVAPAGPPPPGAVMLVNPGVGPGLGLETRAVFAAYDDKGGNDGMTVPVPSVIPGDVSAMIRGLEACRNDLTAAACALQPVVAEVLSAIGAAPGCRLARMSGSGATCFGLFDDAAAAAKAAAEIAARHPGWWTWSGRFTTRS